MSHESSLREKLFRAEPVDPERQQRFQEALAEIVEPRLSRGHRLYYMLSLAGLIAGLPGAVCGLLFDVEHRWIWAVFVLVCGASASWIFYILRRGAEPLWIMQGMSKAASGIAAVATVGLIVYGLQNPSLASVLWALLGLLACLFMWFVNLWNRLLTAERTMREYILRVEYRVAELTRDPR